MVVGQNARWDDMDVQRGQGKEADQHARFTPLGRGCIRLVPHRPLTLEEAIEFIAEDEFVEVTPKSIRLRKKILEYNEAAEKAQCTSRGSSARRPARTWPPGNCEIGNWKLEINSSWLVSNFQFPVSDFQFPVSDFRFQFSDSQH